MADIWYYTIDGQKMGPAAMSELRKLFMRGMLKPNDLVWNAGMPNWIPAARARELVGDDQFTLRLIESPVPAPTPEAADLIPRRRSQMPLAPDISDQLPGNLMRPRKTSGFKVGIVIVGSLLCLVLTGTGLYYTMPHQTRGPWAARNFNHPRDPQNFIVTLGPSQWEKSPVALDKDSMYEVIVKSDPPAPIKLFVRDETNVILVRDTNQGPEAYVTICTRQRGNYEVLLKNENGPVSKFHVILIRHDLKIAADATVRADWQGSFTVDKLDVGGQHSETVRLPAGRHTVIMTSEPDDRINDVDLWITRISDGVRVAQDISFGPRGEVTFLAQTDEVYRIAADNPLGGKETASNIVVKYK